jgi:DNA-binding transcriptional LysR family regulator
MAIFAAVVEAKSFSAAARQLGISKSVVSKQVSRLEDRLGARLLHRTTRRLSLTEEGAAFFSHCERILQEAEEAELKVSRLGQQPRGLLRISAPMSFGLHHVAPAIPEFMAQYPDVQLDLTLDDRFVDLVEDGYDAAVRIGRMADSTLIARKLAVSKNVTVAAPDYLARFGEPKTPAELTEHNCFHYTHLDAPRWVFEGPDGRHTVKIGGNLQANNGEVLVAAAEAGKGIVVTPTFIAWEAIRKGGLRIILKDYKPAPSVVQVVYPHRRHLAPKVRVLVDFLARRFESGPYWDDDLAL